MFCFVCSFFIIKVDRWISTKKKSAFTRISFLISGKFEINYCFYIWLVLEVIGANHPLLMNNICILVKIFLWYLLGLITTGYKTIKSQNLLFLWGVMVKVVGEDGVWGYVLNIRRAKGSDKIEQVQNHTHSSSKITRPKLETLFPFPVLQNFWTRTHS